MVLLFDVDEHTGGFGGAKAYFEGPGAPDRVDGVMIGYPGLDHVVTGGRGVLRARVRVHAVAGHSGSSQAGAGAIAKAADLVRELRDAPLPGPAGPGFPLPAKLTVTAISGGEGYSMVPDLCSINVDIRLTPALDDPAAAALLTRSGSARSMRRGREPRRPMSRSPPGGRRTRCRTARRCARRCCRRRHGAGLAPAAKVAGPSNIGNYLAGLGIPATAGFGVDYQGLHGTDERIRLDSIPVVQAAYHQALLTLLHAA